MIERYVALVNPAMVEASLTVFTRVWVKGQDETTVSRFVEEIKGMPEVMECHLMAGDCDFLLRVVAADLDAYRKFQVTRLGKLEEVQNLKTEYPCRRSS